MANTYTLLPLAATRNVARYHHNQHTSEQEHQVTARSQRSRSRSPPERRGWRYNLTDDPKSPWPRDSVSSWTVSGPEILFTWHLQGVPVEDVLSREARVPPRSHHVDRRSVLAHIVDVTVGKITYTPGARKKSSISVRTAASDTRRTEMLTPSAG